MPDLGDVRATFEIEQSGPEPFPLPLTAHGTAGCEYRAGLISLEPGSVGWTSRPEPCEPTSSAGARVFLDRLAETHTATVVVEWPAEFLILEGDSLRFVLART